ncbi:MAG TPA: hypothetical protein VG325_07725 [Solirubrobacteraceae bacterium]|nr:hypothetical protein [Solirubrobacteraceae bacterium]
MTVLGLAGTALPFAESVDDEVERWLRPLRLYGKAGASLQALGVGEARLDEATDEVSEPVERTPQETLQLVTGAASKHAAERGATTVGTLDILVAVMRHYGDAFERALTRRSSDSEELISRLALQTATTS